MVGHIDTHWTCWMQNIETWIDESAIPGVIGLYSFFHVEKAMKHDIFL
jgi:hypothetical protein